MSTGATWDEDLTVAPRGFWKGYLKLSLVTCPVAMAPATSEAEKIRFHTLNRATGNRVEGIYVDAETGKTVESDDQARGYERAPDSYVILDDDDLDSVALESNRTIDIETFVPADSVEWIWYDTPHFLLPDDPVGEEAFAVIREAMEATGKVGLSRVVLHRRERPVMLEPRGRGIVLWTLHYSDELRRPDGYFEDIAEKADSELVTLVGRLIDKRTRDWAAELVHDPLRDNLKQLIASKRKKKAPARRRAAHSTEDADDTPTNVVNIMDALKKSLAAERRSGGRKS
ncbi:non-homologous end joining protein Ku [Ancylobacter dichloromethanicus]|uniref:Non-homologous end joining protein Ku n=1 Tax=Ancylobacter dichloromethanicus TaxID=518825 RepID=A0A9W6JAK1_9HYPH|nr:non-homologous end joining protein Ku [Ancylobacter dichloromethanicus]